jgi:GMP synthase (glutamine-hydrolysing)
MSDLRFAFLDASHGSAHTPRNFRRELDADLERFDATAGEVPPSFDYDGVVVSGSRASVYWNEEWIPPLKEWVGDAIDRDRPVLGVCFGHQLIADVLGGEIADMGEYELGYREVERVGDSRLFDGVPDSVLVFTTHSDTVAELPPGADRTAENDYGIHSFRADRAFGVQFHPEYDRASAENVTRGKDLPDDRIQRVVDGITRENYRRACEAKQVFDNFCAFARDVREREHVAAD